MVRHIFSGETLFFITNSISRPWSSSRVVDGCKNDPKSEEAGARIPLDRFALGDQEVSGLRDRTQGRGLGEAELRSREARAKNQEQGARVGFERGPARARRGCRHASGHWGPLAPPAAAAPRHRSTGRGLHPHPRRAPRAAGRQGQVLHEGTPSSTKNEKIT